MASSWAEVRAVVIARDGGRCVSCGKSPEPGETDIHHLVPRSSGGLDDPANLVTLCDGCHAARHPNLQASLARRTIERWGLRIARWLDHQHEVGAVDESLGAALRLLGAERFRFPQLEVVLAALRGESVLFVSATGSGKSLCFQIPILLSRGVGVVISPLKALMSQQVSSLQEKQIPGTFINGDLSPDEKKLRYQLLKQGAWKFLYVTPERFDRQMVRPAEIEEITRARPSFFVVDEAHCIDRWGGDFRPNYARLGAAREALGNPPVLAFTATAGLESQTRILQSLGLPGARRIVVGVNRPNIILARIGDVAEAERFKMTDALLRSIPEGRAMIFVPTVAVGNRVRAGLQSLGRDVPFYNSQIGTANERDTILGQFTGRLSPPANVVICTNAFGMGLDVSDVRLVVHWQHPASVEDYLQEFGRAGRDGKQSLAVLFTNRDDEVLHRFMARKTSESVEAAEAREGVLEARYRSIAQMHRRATNSGLCFRRAIVDYFGENTAVLQRSFALRIVEWVFERRRGKQKPQEFCCDKCNGINAQNLVWWAWRVFTGSKSAYFLATLRNRFGITS